MKNVSILSVFVLLWAGIFILSAPIALSSDTWEEIPEIEWGKVTESEWAVANDPSYNEFGAVVLFDEGMAVAEWRGLETERHIRILILTEEGVRSASHVRIEYERHDEFHSLKAQVIRRDGSIEKLDKKAVQKHDKGFVYAREWDFPDVNPGNIVEYSYKIWHKRGVDPGCAEWYFLAGQTIGSNPEAPSESEIEFIDNIWQGISVLPSWCFDHQWPSLRSRFGVKIGSEHDYTFYTTGIPTDCVQPQYRRGSGIIDRVYKYYQWILRDVPPTITDSEEVIDLNRRWAVHFQVFNFPGYGENRLLKGTFTDRYWQELGKSFQGFLNDYSSRSRKMRKLVKDLVSGLTDPQARAEALYAWVATNVKSDVSERYLQPRHPKVTKVFNKKTATPCEVNLLLIEMLRMANLKAWPVLISTREHVSFQNSGQFNHIIILLELEHNNEYVYLDASCEDCLFATLPALCQIEEGLLVDYDSSRLVRVVPGR